MGDKCVNITCLIFRVAKHCSNQVDTGMLPNMYFADKLNILHAEFTRRFGDFASQKGNVELFCNPFAVETVTVELQMELIELQCNGSLKAKCDTAGLRQFIRSIHQAMPQLRLHMA